MIMTKYFKSYFSRLKKKEKNSFVFFVGQNKQIEDAALSADNCWSTFVYISWHFVVRLIH